MKATAWKQWSEQAVDQSFSLLAGKGGSAITPDSVKGKQFLAGGSQFAENAAFFHPADPQRVTKEEFRAALSVLLSESTTAARLLRASFPFFDVDGDGSISPADLREAMGRLQEPLTWVEVRDVLSRGAWRSAAAKAGVTSDGWPEVLCHKLGAQYKDNASNRKFSLIGKIQDPKLWEDQTPDTPDKAKSDVEEKVQAPVEDVISIELLSQQDDITATNSEFVRLVVAKFASIVIKANHKVPIGSARGEWRFTLLVFFSFFLGVVLSVVFSVLYPESFGVFDTTLVVQTLVLFVAELAWECVLSAVMFRYDVKINYTRKLGHLLRLPKYFLADFIPSFTTSPCTLIMAFIFSQALFMLMFMRGSRTRSDFAAFCFLSQDRREDRPYTYRFQVTEDLMRYAIYLPFKAGFLDFLSEQVGKDLSPIIFVPIFINTVGDGLAEPVGVRFGKHKYRTKALYYNGAWCSGSFVRSYEGSFMVFLSAVAILSFEYSLFTAAQFIVLMAILPIAMTLAEAFAPHTNDGPFLALIGCSFLATVLVCVE